MSEPKCPYFTKCGGCTAQHIDYSLQLENSKRILSKALKFDDIEVFSASPYNYRNRMDFIFHKKGLGFRKKGDYKKIIDIEKCPISNEKINVLLKEIRDFFEKPDYFDIHSKKGTFRYAVIRAPQKDSSITFILNSDSEKKQQAIEKVKEYAKMSSANNILIGFVPKNTDNSISEDYIVIKGSDMLKADYLGKRFFFHSQGFFQNNDEMAEKMHEYVNNLLKEESCKQKTFLDLYGGVGTFGIINADLFKESFIVEAYAGCIDAAKINLKENNISNAKTFVLDAKSISRLDIKKPFVAVVDPPRSGMSPVAITSLRRLDPDTIIYISCNPMKFSKELKRFEKEYELKKVAIFDLFPQTTHFETVALLKRKTL
jgi:23S rRNA (uracil-5-)-methyltransferase RumA